MTEDKSRTSISRRKFLYIGGAVVAAAAVGGASYYLRQPPSPTITTTTATPRTTTAPPEKILFTQVLTEELQSADPMLSSGAGGDFSTAINVYDRLFRPTIVNKVEQPEPFLVKDYKVSPDGLKWTMRIREGVKFHDLTEMTAEDVAWSFDRYLQYGKGFATLYIGITEPGMTKAVDKYTVEFNFKKPYGPFPATLCRFYVMNKKLVLPNISKGEQGHDWLHNNDAGSGPYKLKEWRPREVLILTKFDEWWGWDSLYEAKGKRRVTEYNFKPVQEPATMKTMMVAGQADIDDGWFGADTYRSLQGQGQLVLEKNGPWVLQRVISMNNRVFPYDDIHVRKAVSWAFDYEKYLKTFEFDAVQAQGPVPHTLWGHNPNLFVYKQDLTKAKEELALSKYKTSELAKPLKYLTHNEPGKNAALFLAECLKPLGMGIEIEMTTWAKIIGSYGTGDPNQCPINALWGNTAKYPSPDAYLFSPFHSSQWGSWPAQAWYKNPEVDNILDQSRSEQDPNKLLQLYYKAQELIVQDAPMIWLANPYMVLMRQPWVKGFTFRSTLGEYMYLPTFEIEKH